MKIKLYKTAELNGSSFAKTHLRSSALRNIKNDNISCFIWSILAKLQPCEIDHLFYRRNL